MLCGSILTPLSVSAASAVDGLYHGEATSTRIWKSSSDSGKYPKHRIPGIVITKKNTVIIYCEARTGNMSYSLGGTNDWCMMDIYIQRSTDGGKTFGNPIYIAQGNSKTATMNNPVMIVGEDNTLHMLYCKNYSIKGGGIWYRYSTDDGLTWSSERELSEYVDVKHDCFAFGPTHGICTSDGVLMAPVWYVPQGAGSEITSHGPSKAAVFYSTDNGKTWELGDPASNNTNESSIAELSDGSIMMNSRATPYRKVTKSPNGINSWTTTYADNKLPDPDCCGTLVSANINGFAPILLFANCASTSERECVTVRASFDDGKTWKTSYQVSSSGIGGYVDIAVDNTGKVYVLYEVNYGAHVKLDTFSLVDKLCDKEDISLLTSTQKKFVFDNDSSLSYISNTRNLDKEITSDKVLRLTETSNKNYFAIFDFSAVTKNINLQDDTAVVMKIRTSAADENVVPIGGYFCCTATDIETGSNLIVKNVINNGEWQTVVFDLSENPNIAGMLKYIKLEINPDTGIGTTGDWVEIESIEFLPNADGVEDSNNGMNAIIDDTTESPQDDKKGCGSSIGIYMIAPVVCLGAVTSLKSTKKRNKR